jgi:hypothetical protein
MGFGKFLKKVAKVALPIVGTVVGTVIGGPAGGAIGGSLGSMLGNSLGSSKSSGAVSSIIGGIGNDQALSEATKIAQQTADKQLSILEKQYNLTREDVLKAVSDGKITLDATTKQAIDTLNSGYGKAEAYNNSTLDKITNRLSPYMSAGDMAFMQQNDLLGINGQDAQKRAYGIMEQNPQFQTLMKQSENALLQNASATGGLRGGNTQEALAKLRPQLLNQVVQQQLSNLNNVSQTGLSVSQNLANTQTSFAGQNQNLQTGLSNQVGQYQSNLGVNQSNLGMQGGLGLGGITQQYGQNVSNVLGGLGNSNINTILARNQNTQQTIGSASGGIGDILGSLFGGGSSGGGIGNIIGSVFGGGSSGGGGITSQVGSNIGFGNYGTSGFGF